MSFVPGTTLAAALLVLAQLLHTVTAQDSTTNKPGTGGGGVIRCPDIAPDILYTCAQQASWRKCDEPWMFNGAPSPPGSFCTRTCNRCGSIPPPTDVTTVTVRQVDFLSVFEDIPPEMWTLSLQSAYRDSVAAVAQTSRQLVLIKSISAFDSGSSVATEISFQPMPDRKPEADAFERLIRGGEVATAFKNSADDTLKGAKASVSESTVGADDAEVAVPVTADDAGDGQVSDDALGSQLQGRAAEGLASASPVGSLPDEDVPISEVGDLAPAPALDSEEGTADDSSTAVPAANSASTVDGSSLAGLDSLTPGE